MDVEVYIKTILIPEMLKLNSFKLNNPSNIKVLNIEIKAPNSALMLANLRFVEVELKDSEDTKITKSIVVKTVPIITDPDMAEACKMDALFNNEIKAYTECINLMKLEELFAKCLYTLDNSEHVSKVVVLENLNVTNFVMTETTSWLSLDHILLALKTLGQFHGSCYVLKEKNPEKFHNLTKMFVEARYEEQENDVWQHILDHNMKRVLNYLNEKNTLKNEKFKTKVEQILPACNRYLLQTVAPKEPLAVICHGDYTRNNMAFKYDENKTPIDVKLFDLQTLRYASPGIDLSTFLSLYCMPDDLRNHWDLIFGTYHAEIVKALCAGYEKDEKDLPEYYSLNSMAKEYVEYSMHGFLIAAFYLAIVVEPMEVDFFTYMNETTLEQQVEDVYKRGGETVNEAFAKIISFVEELEQRYQCEVQDLH